MNASLLNRTRSRLFLAGLLTCVVGVASALTPTNITANGNVAEWEADENLLGTDGSSWYITHNGSNFFVGLVDPAVSANLATTHVVFYFDTDSQPDPLDGNGTTTGLDGGTLAFNADYAMRWISDNSAMTLHFWDGAVWQLVASPSMARSRNVGTNTIEFRISRNASTLNLVTFGASALKVCGGVVDTVGGTTTSFLNGNSSSPLATDTFANYIGYALSFDLPPNMEVHRDRFVTKVVAPGDWNDPGIWVGGNVPDDETVAWIDQFVTLDGALNSAHSLGLAAGGNIADDGNVVALSDGGHVESRGTWTTTGGGIAFFETFGFIPSTVNVVNPITIGTFYVDTGLVVFDEGSASNVTVDTSGLGVVNLGEIRKTRTVASVAGGETEDFGLTQAVLAFDVAGDWDTVAASDTIETRRIANDQLAVNAGEPAEYFKFFHNGGGSFPAITPEITIPYISGLSTVTDPFIGERSGGGAPEPFENPFRTTFGLTTVTADLTDGGAPVYPQSFFQTLWAAMDSSLGGVLAVDLLSFTGTVRPDRRVALQWETGSEVSNVGFHVWRGDARITTNLVPAQGSDSEGAIYSFVDPSPLRRGEARSYRLQDIDTNGVSTFHDPITVGKTPKLLDDGTIPQF